MHNQNAHRPFEQLAAGPAAATPLRAAITARYRLPEPEALAPLLAQASAERTEQAATQALALKLALRLRERPSQSGGLKSGLVQGLLQEYALSSQEGVALMCLAEALLRIPDAATRDALIRDKLGRGEWDRHLGQSPSLFVNAATWGLMLSGKLVATHSESGLGATLGRLLGKGGEPLIRKGVDLAMRLMGEQFVTGETIEQALDKARIQEAKGFGYSYDMLGEAAMTRADAERYRLAYQRAIQAIGQASAGRGPIGGPGISVKLSALHPRYQRAQYQRVMAELYPVLLGLAQQAQQLGIGLNIDAEEADRLELSLDLLERLCLEPSLAGWDGIGFVVQAYQKRCPAVIDWLIDLGRRSQHRLMVRLVKGAYWDSEIKRAQVEALPDYPVYTRKAHTDVSYLACARQMLGASDAIYPQFATHNAHSLAAIVQMAGPERYQAGQYEFQCLHGMGEPLYELVVAPTSEGGLGRPCRIYAPVGSHETLLAYLVRRLLENGANSSFVNRIADPSMPLSALVEDPVQTTHDLSAAQAPGQSHPAIPLPPALLAPRRIALGLDLSDERCLAQLQTQLQAQAQSPVALAEAILADPPTQQPASQADHGTTAQARSNPGEPDDHLGQARDSSDAEVQTALAAASAFAPTWAATPASQRAALLEQAAERLQADAPALLNLLVREAGKTLANGVAEVREAVDFLRYYAEQARRELGHTAHNTHTPLGPVVCISPWNFPLAIFTGQIAAALAAGNPVLAKPAEQTPLVAAHAVRLLHQAGIPRAALQLLPGPGERVGAALVADARCHGVLFTGSTEVARLLQHTLSQRSNPDGQVPTLIAETGGQNALVVDASALTEQVVGDVLVSAFDSAGQRCSALRVLCLQTDIADATLAMLKGAMAELRIGRTDRLDTDVGPVIDPDARQGLLRHIEAMRQAGRPVFQASTEPAGNGGFFVPPTLIEIAALSELKAEVFGPVLHVLRYRREQLDGLLAQIKATGFGLTLGIHSRIDETIDRICAEAPVGNLYVNRNQVGALVGIQPFGGEGLSGTGPKAGGPLYLHRLLANGPADTLNQALAPWTAAQAERLGPAHTDPALQALRDWAERSQQTELQQACQAHASASRWLTPAMRSKGVRLQGPTGESNHYLLHGRPGLLCLSDQDHERLLQLSAVLALGSDALWPAETEGLADLLPQPVRQRIRLVADWRAPQVAIDAVLHHGPQAQRLAIAQHLAQRPGPIVLLHGFAPGQSALPLHRLLVERSISVNTAAAGGNASLMSLA